MVIAMRNTTRLIKDKVQAMVLEKDEIVKLVHEAEQAKGSAVATDAPFGGLESIKVVLLPIRVACIFYVL
ncbi:hypothetical protein F2Q70_00018888 [Brassica cretica]|uniref:Uncharacterized protein n=5 Tax=Brassica TaxID=3705 RepID=A0A8S9QP35_BRACR|nr:hypothetical protein F2Q70_00018888 [Brassica cretica]KAG2284420.1 hypothetical protein Bca52824_055640 [Brassica carinata]CAF1921598.1 unnamed protein product [Brassica napus]VDD27297.1 unnamed protein product [Brassica oleracea]KAF2597249.1 hypothetical protein F2Q68_00012500 [Brassica cretica]